MPFMPATDGSDPAFPNKRGYDGLTKREYFAAMALQGMLASPYAKDMAVEHGNFAQEQFARSAVMFSDALLAALSAAAPSVKGEEENG